MDSDNPSHHTSISDCQYAFVGNITVVVSKEQGNPPGKVDQKHEKITNVYSKKPFHVSCTRRKELNEIESMFSAMTEDEGVVKTVYLTGQPGSGKTELARQYGEQFKNERPLDDTSKPLVITLNGNSEESLFKSVKEATREISFSEPPNDLMDLMKELSNYFGCYRGAWLLIIDDMFEKKTFNDLFPRPGAKEWGGGRVLVTTQDNNLVPACHQFAKKLSLNGGMMKEDALALLKEISEVEVDDYAEDIIEELQYLPLALACCATYVGETRQDRPSTQFGWKDYLELYRNNVKLDPRTFPNHNDAYPFSMTTATKMAVKRMAEKSDVLRLTFSFLSYCALLPVPLNVLAHYVEENLPMQNNDETSTTKEKDTLEIENEISRCTLLQHGQSQNVETIKCHQVIRHGFQSAENSKAVAERKTEFDRMMKSLNKTLNFMDNTWEEDVLRKVLLRPHLKFFIDHAHAMSCNNTAEFVVISKKKEQFLYSTSEMPVKGAVKSLELLHKISSELDVSEEIHCDILANLGFYYLELDRKDDALKVLSDAYAKTKDKDEKEWLLLRCRVSFDLAQTYYSLKNVHDGIDMMKTSIDLAKIAYSNEENKIMERFFWLAEFYYSTWTKFWKLGAVVSEATEFLSRLPDSESLSRASCLDYLSRIYGLYAVLEAKFKPERFLKYGTLKEEFINKSLEVYEHVLGADVSACPDYCLLLAESAFLKLQIKPIEAEAQVAEVLKYCEQNGDKYNHSCIAARKKHLIDNSTYLSKLIYFFENLARGRWLEVEQLNINDDILKDCESGRTSPSPRKLGPIRKRRSELVRANVNILAILAIYVVLILQDRSHQILL